MRNFMEKLNIAGEVLCDCGGVLISNSGKVDVALVNYNKIRCGDCYRLWDADYAFEKRIEGKTIKLENILEGL
jgi:hypothetical protein